MHQTIKDKIIELYRGGTTHYRDIQDAIRNPTTISQPQTVPRSAYPLEAELYQLLIPTVVTLEEIVAQPAKTEYVRNKLNTMYDLVPAASKPDILALSLRVTSVFEAVTAAGSQAFNDPEFMQPTRTVDVLIPQPSWLTANGFSDTDLPPKYEILDLVAQATA